MARLTKRTVDSASPGKQDYFLWDDNLKGFGLRVYTSGRKTYLIQYRSNGRTRRLTLGPHGPLTPDTARKKAMTLLAGVADGSDPSGERNKLRNDITVGELCDIYLTQVRFYKKPSTLATDEGRIARHIKPLLGERQVQSVTSDDVARFLQDVAGGKTADDVKTRKHGRARVTGGKGTSSRTVGLLGGIFTFAVKKGLRPDNPVHGVERPKDGKRDRFLTENEIRRIGGALEASIERGANAFAIAAIRLLLLTGCRKSEILGLRWQDVDFQNGYLHLVDSKTGDRLIPLNPPAIAILEALPRLEGNQFVFPSNRGNGHYTGLQKVWSDLRAEAGLEDVRIHDLRRSFGSMAVAGGESLYMVSKLLGHRDTRTTEIYAHFTDDARKRASGETASRIEAALSGEVKEPE